MHAHMLPNRRGITLMEVMISIGILAVGLTSVLSIIPAGKSEVSRAIVHDRASALAANALADAATFGLLKPESSARSAPQLAVFDPSLGASLPTGTATLKPEGIFSSTTTAALPAGNSSIVLQLLAQGRDDISYNGSTSADALPTNQFSPNGPRAFQGRMSCMLVVTSTAAISAGNFAKLSAIVFHNRDLSAGASLTASGTWTGSEIMLNPTTVPADRTAREVLRPNAVISTGSSFHQLAMAAVSDGTYTAYVSFNGARPPTGTAIVVLLDSVGLAEKTVVLEGPGPWSH